MTLVCVREEVAFFFFRAINLSIISAKNMQNKMWGIFATKETTQRKKITKKNLLTVEDTVRLKKKKKKTTKITACQFFFLGGVFSQQKEEGKFAKTLLAFCFSSHFFSLFFFYPSTITKIPLSLPRKRERYGELK